MLLEPSDLAAFADDIPEAKALAMIEDATAMANRAAPCLVDESALSLTQSNAVKAILRRAVLRWHDVGSGAVTQVSSGPFQQSMDTSKAASKSLFWPSEITDLQDICREVTNVVEADRQVFTVNTGRRGGGWHSPICDLRFGGLTCSCGSSLNAYRGPLYEFGEVVP